MDELVKEKAKKLADTLKKEASDELELNFLLLDANRILERELKVEYGLICARNSSCNH